MQEASTDLPFLIFSSPRSRSTLLTRILDDTPNVRCGGECIDLFWKIKRLHAERGLLLERHSKSFRPLNEQISEHHFPCYLNHSSDDSWNRIVKEILRGWVNPGVDHFAWGMKDVHAAKEGAPFGIELWSWLQNTVPNLRLIFLTRKCSDILKSMRRNPEWWNPTYAQGEAEWERKVRQQQLAFREYHALNPSSTILIDANQVLNFSSLSSHLSILGIPVCPQSHTRHVAIHLG